MICSPNALEGKYCSVCVYVCVYMCVYMCVVCSNSSSSIEQASLSLFVITVVYILGLTCIKPLEMQQ